MPDVEHVKFTPEVDPLGIMEGLAQGGFVHTEENEVLYFSQVKGAAGDMFEPALPQIYRVGDIVEVQMTWVAVPLKGGKYKMMSVLRSIALLDGHFTKDAKDKGMGQPVEVKKTERLKRRARYEQNVSNVVVAPGYRRMGVDD